MRDVMAESGVIYKEVDLDLDFSESERSLMKIKTNMEPTT